MGRTKPDRLSNVRWRGADLCVAQAHSRTVGSSFSLGRVDATHRKTPGVLAQEPGDHGDPHGRLVHRHVRRRLVRQGSEQHLVLRFPARLLHVGAGLLDHLRGDHLHLRPIHEQPRQGLRGARGRRRMSAVMSDNRTFFNQLKKYYGICTGGFVTFVVLLAIAEQMGMSRQWIGYWFLFATIALYAVIGIMSRTVNAEEYYVAGRRVPAFFNGMATGADWMSAASFIGMAGTLYLSGFDGLAFVMGWTGGYVLVALFLAPYLRKFGQ